LGRALDEAGLTASFRAHANIGSSPHIASQHSVKISGSG